MSAAERKAIRIIVLLEGIIAEGHFKIYTEEMQSFVDELYKLYNSIEVDKKSYDKLKQAIVEADKIIGTSGYNSNFAMLFTMILEIAEEFVKYTQGRKAELWERMYNYAIENDFHKHLIKKQLLQVEIESIDKGIQLAKMIKGE